MGTGYLNLASKLYGASPSASAGANAAALNTAINDAVAAGGGKLIYFPGTGSYRMSPVKRYVDNLHLESDGAAYKFSRTNSPTNIVEGLRLIGNNLSVRGFTFVEGTPLATQAEHIAYPGYTGVRIGGEPRGSGNLIADEVTVEHCIFKGTIGQACVLYYADHARAANLDISDVGEGCAAESCRGHVEIDKVNVKGSADDCIIVKSSNDNGGTQTQHARVTNSTAENGNAKGITLLGVVAAQVATCQVRNVNQFGVAVFDDPGFGNLLPPDRCSVQDVLIEGAGAWHGSDPSKYLYNAPNASASGFHTNVSNVSFGGGSQIYDTQGHAVFLDGASAFGDVTIDGVRIAGATGNGVSAGNPDGSGWGHGGVALRNLDINLVRSGIVAGELTDFVVADCMIRGYKFGGSGARRGIQLGHCRNGMTRNYIRNTDGGAEQYFEYNGCTNITADNVLL